MFWWLPTPLPDSVASILGQLCAPLYVDTTSSPLYAVGMEPLTRQEASKDLADAIRQALADELTDAVATITADASRTEALLRSDLKELTTIVKELRNDIREKLNVEV